MTYSFKTTFLLAASLGALAFTACTTTESHADTATPAVTTSAEVMSSDTLNGTAKLTVIVTGFEKQQGAVMAALADEASYGNGKPLRGAMQAVNGETLTLTFDDLPVGTYALRMFHDVDGNGELNTNVFGIPTEPYAFSNNATGTMGPAPWSKAKFDVTADGAVQNITF